MNPVLQKEVLQTLREKRVAVVQLLFVVVLGLGVLACWPHAGGTRPGGDEGSR